MFTCMHCLLGALHATAGVMMDRHAVDPEEFGDFDVFMQRARRDYAAFGPEQYS